MLVAVIVTALLLQTTVFPRRLTLLGVKPELLYLVTVIFAVLQGPAEGAVVGFVGGLAQDFMLNMPKGITALTLTMLGYTVGLARQYITSPSPLLARGPGRPRHGGRGRLPPGGGLPPR